MNENNTYKIENCACTHCSFEDDVVLVKGVKLGDAICDTCGNAKGLYKKSVITSYYEFE